MTRLTLNFLGPFQVILNDESVTSFKSIKVRALLVYLAVEADRPHQRTHLAGLLWPDYPHRAALNNLRYALSDLRRAIGDRTAQPPFLSISRETLQFNLSDQVRLDVAEFSRAIAEARRRPEPERVTLLESAIQQYQGDLLAEFPDGNELPFEEWLLFTREQYARQLMDALNSLSHVHLNRANYPAAERYLRRLLRLAPWQEDTHRRLMRLLALDGRRGAALTQYEQCRRALATELGVEPSRETTRLYERIRDERLPQATGPDRPPPAVDDAPRPPGQPLPFVARQRELARLDEFLEAALAGRSRVVFVTGEAGSGKSLLLREFSRRAMTRYGDLVVVGGQCDAFTGLGDPFQPFREILQMLAGDIEARRAGGEITTIQARRLWRIFPAVVGAIHTAGPDLIDLFVSGEQLARQVRSWPERLNPIRAEEAAPADPFSSDEAHWRPQPAGRPQVDLFAQVTRVLHELAQQQPLLLTLDDLQWIDAGSAGLLFHLSRHLRGSRILIVGTYRPAEIRQVRAAETADSDPARHPLQAVVNELVGQQGDVQVDLDQADPLEFVAAALDAQPNELGSAFRQTLARQTGGNALFIMELLRGLQAQGGLVQDQTGRWVEGDTLDWARLPRRVEAVIAERMAHLRPEWQALLTVASVEGQTFTAEQVARVQNLPAKTVIRLLSGPLSQQYNLVAGHSVARLNGGRLSRYRFRHHLFQTYLYNRLDEVRRSHLHEAVGLTLEALYADQTGETEIDLQLARHFEAAGLTAKAVAYLYRAGQRAVRLSANEEAIALFNRGLALLERLPESPERAEWELELRLALNGPLFAFRGWGAPERVRDIERAGRLSRQLGAAGHLTETLFMQADLCRARGDYDTAFELGERLWELAQRNQAPDQLLLAHATLGETQFFQGRFAPARTHFEAVAAHYQPDRHQALVSLNGLDIGITSRAWLTWTLWLLGYPDQAQAQSREALTLAQALGQPFTTSFVLAFAGCSFSLLRGETQQAGQELEALARIAVDEEITFMQVWSRIYRGWGLAAQGQVAAGIDQMRVGLADWQETGAVIAGATRWPLVETYRQAGLAEAGLTLVDDTLAAIDRTGERVFEAEMYRLKGELLLLMESSADRAEAERCFWQAIEVARWQEARSWELRAALSLARLEQHTARGDAGRRLVADLYHRFEEGFDTPDLQTARHCRVRPRI